VIRRSAAELGAGWAATVALTAPASSGVPHSLQKRPVPGVPQAGQARASGVPHDEQNFAPSALDSLHEPQTVTSGAYVRARPGLGHFAKALQVGPLEMGRGIA